MVSKNNIAVKEQQSSKKVNKYGLRKLTVGTASVLLGVTMYGTATADADTITPNSNSVSANQATQANVDTHEIDISSASTANTSTANSDVAPTANANNNLSNSSAVLQAASAAVNSAQSALSASAASQDEQTSNASSAVSTKSETASKSASDTNSASNSSNSTMATINTADLQTASPANVTDSKVAAAQAPTNNDVTISDNQDGNANEKLVGTGQSKTVTLDDGSTLTTQYDQLDSKNQTAILTFKSSSFKAGDTYTIKIPTSGGLTVSSNDVASLQPAFGKTTVFNDFDYCTITNKFISSGTISQAIKVSYNVPYTIYDKKGAYTKIDNTIIVYKNDTQRASLQVSEISQPLSLSTSGKALNYVDQQDMIDLANLRSPLLINNSEVKSSIIVNLTSMSNLTAIYNTALDSLSFHLDSSLIPAGLTINSISYTDPQTKDIVTHNFDNNGDVILSDSEVKLLRESRNITFTLNSTVSADASQFYHHKYSIKASRSGVITVHATDNNHYQYNGPLTINAATIIDSIDSVSADTLMSWNTSLTAAYTDNDYKTPINISSVVVINNSKNNSTISELSDLQFAILSGSSVKSRTNYDLQNFIYTLNIPDGLDIRAYNSNETDRKYSSIKIETGKKILSPDDYALITYRDNTTAKVSPVKDTYAGGMHFETPIIDKAIKSISVHLQSFEGDTIRASASAGTSAKFDPTYIDGTPVQDGDLLQLTATVSADGIKPITNTTNYIRTIGHSHNQNLSKGIFDAIINDQLNKTPGVSDAGSLTYESVSSAYGYPQYEHPVMYIKIPSNTAIHDLSSIYIKDGLTASWTDPDSKELTPKSISTLQIGGSTFIKIDLSNYNKIDKGFSAIVHYDNLPDLQSSSEQSVFLITADNLNDNSISYVSHYDGDQNSSIKNAMDQLIKQENIDLNYTNYCSTTAGYQTTWDILTADGIGSATMAAGNKTVNPTLNGYQDDHGENADTFNIYGTTINASDTTIPGAVQVINVPNTNDGHSQFNPQLTGPIKLVNANTGEDLSNLVSIDYSTELADLAQLNGTAISNPMSADQVSDWSKIKSVMIRFKQSLPKRTSARAVLTLKDPQIYDHAGKTIYVSNVVFVTASNNDYHLQPLYIKPGSPASARLIVEGQSSITTWVHYQDADGKDQYVQLPDKIKTYNELSDVMNRSDFMSSDSDLTIYDRSLLPSNLVIDWNSQPTIQNANNTYLNGYQNGTAEFGKTVKYDFDGDRVVYEAAFAKQVTQDNKTVKRTIHYKYTDGSTAKPDVEQISKKFSNIGFENPFTHQVTWADTTETDTLVDVNSPVIAGYKADQSNVSALTVNFNSNDSEVTVVYTPDIQQAVINYIDDTTGQTLKTDHVQGNSDSAINYQTKTQIDQYLNQHYILVSNDFNDGHENYDHDSTATQTFNVHLKHDTQVVSDNRTKKLIVHYVYAQGQPLSGQAHADQTANDIVFSRTGTTDLVTNQTTWSNWNISSATFDAVNSPVIAGYTSDHGSIKDITVDPDSVVLTEKTIIYKADTQKIVVNYIDNTTGQTLNHDQLTGLSGASADYTTKKSIDGYINQGYDLVSDATNGQNVVFDTDANTDQVYDVHLKHHLENVSRTSEVDETINYVYANGSQAAPQYKAPTISFIQTGVKDHVTNTIVWNNVDSQEFTSVQSPKIDGYTADQSSIPAITVHFGDQNITRTVTYSANTQNLDVTFIDDTTGETLKTIKKSGPSDTSADYSTQNDIDSYKAQHYNLVSDSTDEQSLVFDRNDNTDQHYEVHLSHATHQINENHDVDQVIYYVYADGLKAADDHTANIHFTRDGYHDEVTGEDHWNTWTPGSAYDFAAVQSPKIQGFTPDISTVDQVTVNPSSQNVERTVTYYGNVQLAHVKYIDDSDNGHVMSSDDLSGHTGETDSYTTAKNIKNYTSQGYVFVSDNYPVAGVVFDNNDLVDQYFEVHFKHGTVTVTPDQPGNPNQPINPGDPDGPRYPAGTDAKSLQADVSRTIDYVYQNGKQAQPSVNDSLHFIETKMIDKVTGKVLSDTWSPAQDFETKITPTIDGYTPDRQAVSNTGIDHTHPAIHEVVTYNPDVQKAVVKYIDDTDQKQLSADDLTGRSDEDSGYNTKSLIDQYLAEHYVLVSDDTNGQNVFYDHNDNKDQTYEVHFKHGTETISESRTKSLTVHYIYADDLARTGKAADDQNAQSLTFNRTGVKDLVTNEIVWNAWDHASQTFEEIESPVIAGYTPNQVSIKDVQVTANSPELTEKTVVYNADSQKIAINYIDDVTGKTLQTINLIGKSDSNSGYITKQSIAWYLKQHYGLVSDDTNGEELVYDHDSSITQVYNVHLNHHTHVINDQTTKSEVIHYVYADGLSRIGKAADDYHANKLTFTRDGYCDEVTNEDHWNAWTPAQQEFASVKSPDIQGYTADQVEIPAIEMNSASDNIERTVTYNANNQKLDVVFIDDTTGETLSTVTREGLSDESANYNTKDDIAHYQGLHYDLVSDGTSGQDLVFDHDDSKDQHYEVHLVHATHPIDEQTSTKQTIHYQLANGTKVFNDYTAKVAFSRDGYNDEVTNENHWNTWTPSDTQTFGEVASPIKQGYTPDKTSVAAVDVQPGDHNLEETVIYLPNEQKITVNYIDDVMDKTLSTKQITGVSDVSANYNAKSVIDGYIADHYKLVSDDTNGNDLVFDHDDNVDQVYNVHLTHTYQNVDDHTTVNETVHYIYDNGQTAHDDYTAPAINFNRTGTRDLVTNNVELNDWTPSEQNFVSVTTPAINGYTPDIEVVPSVTVNHSSKDVERTVTYHADDQTILVNYIDDDTQSTLKTDTVIGETAQKSNYTTEKSINGYIADHYELVNDETTGKNLVFDADSTKVQVYNVHLKHAHQNVNELDSINETIHYIYTNGSKVADDVHAPAINFSRTGDKDLVTNTIAWNTWTPESQDFVEVKSPVISGYTPSQKVVSAVTVKPGDKDVEQTVVYAPDTQSIIVNYIDDVTGKTLKTDSLTGKSDQISDYSTKSNIDGYITQHYKLVSDDTNGEMLTFDHDDQATQVYNVHLTHETQLASQSKAINETIHYVFTDGSKAAGDYKAQPLTFSQTGVKDLVTGDINWNGAWTADQTFIQVKSPVITGYTASQTVVDPITVSHDANDITQTIIYTANNQVAKINYIDDATGDVLEVDSNNGKFGDQIKFGHNVDGQIKTFENQGYKLKSNNFNGQKYQADDLQNEFEVHFTHGTQNVSRTDRVTETVKYQFENAQTAQPDHVQTAEFTQHGVQDLVTKTIVWTPSDSQQFEEVITPKFEGYTPDITNVAAVTINFGDNDINKVVIYKANDQAAGVKYIDDTAGKVLKSDLAAGKFGQAIIFNEVPTNIINDFVNNGYKFVSSNFNGQTYQADNAKNQFEVHLIHNTENVTRTSDVLRTIKYQYSNGSQAKPNVHQAAHFEQTGVKDLVTGNIDWADVPSQSFDGVQAPLITGYTPDVQTVKSQVVNFGDRDQTIIATYSANDQLAGIKYIDDTSGKTLDSQAASGKFGTLVEFMTDTSVMIRKFENQGYEFVSNNFNGQDYQADNSQNQFEVHFKHDAKDVTRTSTVTRTIKYVDGQTGNEIHQPVTQTLTFTENGVTDLVTGETVWTTPGDQHFGKVQSPDIDGYENPDIPVVDSETAKFGDGDQTVTVSYHKVKTPSTPDTPSTPSVPDTPLTPDISDTHSVRNASNVSTTVNASTNNTIRTTQSTQQNINSKQSQANDQQTAKKTDEEQLPQTGNQENHQLGLIGLASAAFAGLISLGKKKHRE